MTLLKSFLWVVLLLTNPLFAAPPSNGNLGGLGFLFADPNNFYNSGDVALTKGTAVQGTYVSHGTPDVKYAQAATSYSTGAAGFGIYGARQGSKLTDSALSTDLIGGKLGILVGKNVSVGVGYDRSIDGYQEDDGVLRGSLTLHPTNKGFAIGGGGSTTFNADVDIRTVYGGIGYLFSPKFSVEADVSCNDIDVSSDLTFSGFINFKASQFYGSLGGSYYKLTQLKQAKFRFGIMLSQKLDVSFIAGKYTESAYDPYFGATLRIRL